MSRTDTYVVVGAGQAGGRAAEAIRGAGFSGRLVVVGAERVRPYERPPLSKQVLTGAAAPDTAFLRAPDYYDEHGIELMLNQRVEAIDRGSARLTLAGGETLAYDKLLLATGSRVRRLALPGSELAGIHYLRDLDDSLTIAKALRAGARVVIVGGGYIGLEVAAAARKRGCAVTVLEAGDGLMRRQVAEEVGDWYADLHRRHGVEIVTGANVEAFEGGSRVQAVRLADGTAYPADLAVVGVGILPNVELAADAGLEVDDGIVVDACGRTSDPAIFAAGDVTRHPNPILGRRVRLESWQNAQNQAVAAGRTMAGEETPYAQVPWFWSDQYDVNLQMVGLPDRVDRLVRRGDPEGGAFTLFYLKDGRIVGANAVNSAKDIAPTRKFIETGAKPDPDMLSDPETSLKKVLKAAG
ncbi:NAD(P)/FAD-dependent oxidoreductase [Ferruginivarius sediminum]|uniref:Pyridine nucleotide-disulfide oxidoreductase n=1 Tax=Ferruginivarius sediminum TaxID=2661937 RepID=A0A369T7Z9_9PROT|nr:FAD-dependent oxidoreductase [Ferruginivarius sediminum]RDD60584.1 pyridine nucleotide-disulfide oxidoreductase [Ferruginivarius sediminum]